jgi:hypothetical protein
MGIRPAHRHEQTAMPTRSLAAALNDSEAGPLLTRLAQHQRIGACIAEALGPLAEDTGCAGAGAIEQRGTLVLLRVSTTASAAKLRQTVPKILGHLRRRGIQVTEIRVKVQPAAFLQPIDGNDPAQDRGLSPVPAPRPGVDPAHARALADALSSALPESPLQRAAERLRKTLARSTRQSGTQKHGKEQQARGDCELEDLARPLEIAPLTGQEVSSHTNADNYRK